MLDPKPAIELGTHLQWANGTLVRPYVRGGVTLFDEMDFTLQANSLSAPSQVSPFRIRTGIDDVHADVSAGVEVLSAGGASLSSFMTGASAKRSRRMPPA
jgi:hypothetical protein